MSPQKGERMKGGSAQAIYAKEVRARQLAGDEQTIRQIEQRMGDGATYGDVARELLGGEDVSDQEVDELVHVMRQGASRGILPGISDEVRAASYKNNLNQWRIDPKTGQWTDRAKKQQQIAAEKGGYALKKFRGGEQDVIAGLLKQGLTHIEVARIAREEYGINISPDGVGRLKRTRINKR